MFSVKIMTAVSQIVLFGLVILAFTSRNVQVHSYQKDEGSSDKKSALVFVKEVGDTPLEDDDGFIEEEPVDGENSIEEFVATEEWQEVKKGQKNTCWFTCRDGLPKWQTQ